MASLFAQRVEIRLQALGWNRAKLAKELKISAPGVSMALNEGRNPQKETLAKWAAVLGVSEAWLLGLDDKPPPVDPIEEYRKDVIAALLRATPAQLNILRHSLEGVFPDLAAGPDKRKHSG